jgi:AcrR family transcriptional regulator
MYVKSRPTRKPQRSAERRTNPQRTAATRAALIDAARRLFIDRGYADTSTPEIVAAADVTRGALYHHFEDKRALFRAVVEAELSAVAGEIEQSSDPGGSPFEALVAGTDAYFRAMRSSGRTRLLLVEAPAVFGWAGLYEIDDKHGTRTLREGLAAAMDAGTIRPLPLDALTILMAALFDRGALAIDSGGEAADFRAVVVAVFEGLRTADVRPGRKRR